MKEIFILIAVEKRDIDTPVIFYDFDSAYAEMHKQFCKECTQNIKAVEANEYVYAENERDESFIGKVGDGRAQAYCTNIYGRRIDWEITPMTVKL